LDCSNNACASRHRLSETAQLPLRACSSAFFSLTVFESAKQTEKKKEKKNVNKRRTKNEENKENQLPTICCDNRGLGSQHVGQDRLKLEIFFLKPPQLACHGGKEERALCIWGERLQQLLHSSLQDFNG